MSRKVLLVLSALACLMALPAAARAQSAFAGVVKDSSGAVLPGVTVSAASDALIEKSREVTTDGAGLYKIINLRPGIYVVTFTLTGFATVKHDSLELPSDFTMTVDAAMKVGTLEESITVSTASPVVDVQSNVKSQVLSRETLDAVPNAHTIQSIGQLIPGVSLTSPDVGGSAQMQQTYFSVHGTGASGTSLAMDGMIINGLQGDGAIQTYMNDSSAAEMVYGTGGGGGAQQTGGLQINVVPREGGNRFSGQIGLAFENWQSDNFGQELKDVGVTSTDQLGHYHDVTAAEGGPIMKDRLWFFSSGRLSLEEKPVANTTNSAAFSAQPMTDAVLINPVASAAALAACRAANTVTLGACPQGTSPETVNSALGRLTLQLNSKNKVSAYLDRIHKDRASAMGSRDDQRITGIHWTSPLYMTNTVKWTSTISNKLLLQGGWSGNTERYNNLYQDGIEQPLYGPLWSTMVTRSYSPASTRSIAGSLEYGSYPDRYNWQGSASYVTGSHNIQLGFQDSFGTYNQRGYLNGDIAEAFVTTNGVDTASTATLHATSPWWDDSLKYALGIFAQDSWTRKRMTVTYGMRFDAVREAVVGQPIGLGTYAVIPAYPDKDMPKQTNWEPHVSIVYDLFGNGKTAIRAGYNRFVNAATTSLASGQDPGGDPTTSRNWTDVNGDSQVQMQVTHNPTTGQLIGTCVYKTAGCELDFSTLSATYGSTVINNVQDPNLKRTYQNKFNLGISHELMKGVSVTFEWFRTDNPVRQSTINVARLQPCGGLTGVAGMSVADAVSLLACDESLTPAQKAANPDYQQINVFSPIDGHLVNPVYDFVSATVNAAPALNYISNDPDPTYSSVYNGFDVGFNARLPRGGRMFGGTTTERTLTNTCGSATTPGGLINCDQSNLVDPGTGPYSIPWQTQIKLAVTYPLPWLGLVVNGSYQGLPGPGFGTTTYTITKGVTKYTTCPGNSVAQGCAVGALVAPTAINNLSANLDNGQAYMPRTNQVDFGIAKRLKFGRLRIDPKIDMFNALNSDATLSSTTSVFSPILDTSLPAAQQTTSAAVPSQTNGFVTYHQPSRFLQGRIFRLGANITW